MELRDLQRLTVVKLREEAFKHSSITGVNGMAKSELIEALAPLFGIDLAAEERAARERFAGEKTALKQAIRGLKAERRATLADSDATRRKQMRLGIKQRKRALRRMARMARAGAR